MNGLLKPFNYHRMQAFERVADLLNEKVPKVIALELKIIEAEPDRMHRLLADLQKQRDHGPRLSQALLSEPAGAFRITATQRGEIKSGGRMVLDTAKDILQSQEINLSNNGTVALGREIRQVGLIFEADPVLLANQRGVDLNYGLEYHFSPPEHRDEPLNLLGAPQKFPIPMTDLHFTKTVTSSYFDVGATKLLSVWTVPSNEVLGRPEIMQAAFLTVHLQSAIPAPNTRLQQILTRLADKVETVSPIAEGRPQPLVPAGMELRTFPVPAELLQSTISDPFAPSQEADQALRRNPETILKAEGIPFPEGSLATFDPYNHLLTVVNTTAALDAVEAYTSGGCRMNPAEILHTIEIVQADANSLQHFSNQTKQQGDHTQVWNEIEKLISQNKAKHLRTIHLDCRSGQRGVTQAGQEMLQAKEIEFISHDKVPVAPAAVDENKREVPTPTDASTMRVVFEDSQLIGTRLELDPVITPDGQTIDLNLSLEYHYASPTPQSEPAAHDSPLPIRNFHRTKIATSTILSDGCMRLLSIWKPEGTAEFNGKAVLQAAFIRVNIRRPNPD
ncbi:hypothetical protein FEM03_19120 [Phragmitibacter flavus]|uniref:Uncharacterized protein n=1 Tax=Phragmitibacter flavus TaxID=2576071 RepID=A0A5R8KA90_9BACT|nr:hypothetical protein [Phragmitibacter flavus]TLD69211.1 hypothetical protein FEM03_19120 [Phragmitibacter flavus]